MRKFLIISLFLILSVAVFEKTYGADPCDQAVTKEEVQKLFAEGFPDAKILDVRPSPVRGLVEVAIESRNQKTIYYLDTAKKHVLVGGLFDFKTKANLTQERLLELNKIDISLIPLDDAVVMGEKNAKHRVIVFDDPE
ncbi:MAG: disulfide isomerase DsbC N-terminal domain-containing protein [Nitrospirota bacterium]